MNYLCDSNNCDIQQRNQTKMVAILSSFSLLIAVCTSYLCSFLSNIYVFVYNFCLLIYYYYFVIYLLNSVKATHKLAPHRITCRYVLFIKRSMCVFFICVLMAIDYESTVDDLQSMYALCSCTISTVGGASTAPCFFLLFA